MVVMEVVVCVWVGVGGAVGYWRIYKFGTLDHHELHTALSCWITTYTYMALGRMLQNISPIICQMFSVWVNGGPRERWIELGEYETNTAEVCAICQVNLLIHMDAVGERNVARCRFEWDIEMIDYYVDVTYIHKENCSSGSVNYLLCP